jgi:hypothetical protein
VKGWWCRGRDAKLPRSVTLPSFPSFPLSPRAHATRTWLDLKLSQGRGGLRIRGVCAQEGAEEGRDGCGRAMRPEA